MKLENLLDSFLANFAHDIAIDLGTANTLVHVRGKGIVIREPSVVTRHKKKKTILAVGTEAKRMLGKTPGTIEAVRPLRSGVISDFDSAQALLSYFIKKTHKTYRLFPPKIPRPRVVVGIPSGVTEVERKAVVDACRRAGARKVYLLEEPMAAAIGANLPVSEPEGSMVVDIGGGTSEIAVISLGGMVALRSVRVAGDELDQAIVDWARDEYALLIGENSAEAVKIAIGSAWETEAGSLRLDRNDGGIKDNSSFKHLASDWKRRSTEESLDTHADSYDLRGRDLKTGLPKKITVTRAQIREVLLGPLSTVIANIKEVIEETPPELLSDIAKNGMVLAGGGALIDGIDQLIAQQTKLSVAIANDPVTAVCRGCAKTLSDLELLERVRIATAV